ncbi:hypothetical protein ACFSTC_12240 [Nonomuraea ferruginea]
MSVTTLFPGRSPAFGDLVTDVYRYASRKGVIEAVEVAAEDLGLTVRDVREAVANLVESWLLRVDDSEGVRFVPVDPELAAASLVSSVEREIYQRRELIDQIRERMGALQSEYAGAEPRFGGRRGGVSRGGGPWRCAAS